MFYFMFLKKVGFEPTIVFTNRFTVYRLRPLGHFFDLHLIGFEPITFSLEGYYSIQMS